MASSNFGQKTALIINGITVQAKLKSCLHFFFLEKTLDVTPVFYLPVDLSCKKGGVNVFFKVCYKLF